RGGPLGLAIWLSGGGTCKPIVGGSKKPSNASSDSDCGRLMIEGWMAGQRSFEGLTLNLLHNAWFPVQRHASVKGRPAMATLLITVGCCRPLGTKDRDGTLEWLCSYKDEKVLRSISDSLGEE